MPYYLTSAIRVFARSAIAVGMISALGCPSPLSEQPAPAPAKSSLKPPTAVVQPASVDVPPVQPQTVVEPQPQPAEQVEAVVVSNRIPPVRAKTKLLGCLADPAGKKATTERLRQKKGDSKSSVTITKEKNGIGVAHELSHACCLKAEVKTKVKGTQVHIAESLFGTPCKCLCTSTIQTTVPLAKKTYKVTVELTDRGKTETVHEQEISL